MKHRKASVSWQNDMVELSKKEQVVIFIFRLRTRYSRATHRHITDTFCDVRNTTNHIQWQCNESSNERDECGIQSTA
jgi:hypothetical protein